MSERSVTMSCVIANSDFKSLAANLKGAIDALDKDFDALTKAYAVSTPLDLGNLDMVIKDIADSVKRTDSRTALLQFGKSQNSCWYVRVCSDLDDCLKLVVLIDFNNGTERNLCPRGFFFHLGLATKSFLRENYSDFAELREKVIASLAEVKKNG